MRAVRCAGPGQVEVIDLPAPAGEGVCVAIRYAGICGTDLEGVRAGTPTVTLGHEMAGLDPHGRPVVVQPNVPCDACPACARGDDHLCPTGLGQFHGVAALDGGMADAILAAEKSVFPVPEGLSLEHAVLAEPLAVSLHGVERLTTAAPARILVIGGGAIGLCAAACAAAAGYEVDLVARHEQRRAAAAPWVQHATAEPREGMLYAAVLNCAGSDAAMATAIDVVVPGGEIVAFGGPGWAPPLSELSIWKELQIRTTVIYRRSEFVRALELLRDDPRIAERIVSHQVDLDDAARAFAIAGGQVADEPALKVVLRTAGA